MKQKRLTKAELEILKLAASGLAVKQIADALCKSENTIKNQRYIIRRKLHAKSSEHAIAIFVAKINTKVL